MPFDGIVTRAVTGTPIYQGFKWSFVYCTYIMCDYLQRFERSTNKKRRDYSPSLYSISVKFIETPNFS
ncbi:hypothetical protein J2Z83_000251 [Virgibacillus natechei]|uniref:Uncharacterized protein n=1 Tax=Virgibacillus natechei TaxID=1216297 RepID=A0ABS4IB45_9BACI|nr:hypothetical protein [Virgibacillus natechei]